MRYIFLILFLSVTQIASSQVDEDYNYEFALIEANRQKSIGSLNESINLYKKCLSVKPESGIAAYELGNIYIALQDEVNALQYFRMAYYSAPDNYWYLIAYIEILKSTGEYKEGEDIIRSYLKKKEDSKLRYSLAVFYAMNGQEKKALKNLDYIESKGGISESVILKKLDIYKSLEKYEKGERELQKLIDFVPEAIDYYIVMAEYLNEIGDKDRAVKYFLKAYDIDSLNLYAVSNLAEYYINKNNFSEGFIYLNKTFQLPQIKLENKVNALIFYMEEAEFFNAHITEIESLIFVLQKFYPDENIVKRLTYDFYFKSNNLEEAYVLIRELAEEEEDNYNLWQQAIFTASLLNEYDDILELGNRAISYFPNKPDLYLYIGIAYFQKNEFLEAHTILSDNFKIGLETGIQIQYLTFLAESSYKLNLQKEAFSYFEELILLNPDNTPILNNYSYYLSLTNTKLERAEKLSKRTIEREPDNPIYLDTYGWILFSMERIDEAVLYLEKAVSISEDPDILFHYAEALFKTNKPTEAKSYYEKALEKGYDAEIINKKIVLCQ